MIPRSLPVVDDPFPDESLYGFVLRMSGRNRLAGMTWVLAQLGRRSITQLGESDDRAIAHLFGANPDAVNRLVVRGRWVDGTHRHWIRGLEITRPYLLRLARPQWCPLCLVEGGFARAAWDLQLVTACHLHGVQLLERCPKCSRLLRWQRRDLRNCLCGGNLCVAEARPAEPGAVDVAAWIASHLDASAGGLAKGAQVASASPWQFIAHGLSVDGGMRLLYGAGLKRDAGHRVGPGEARAGLTTSECRDVCARSVDRLRSVQAQLSHEDKAHLRALFHLPALVALAIDGLEEADRQMARSLLEAGLAVSSPRGRLNRGGQHAQLSIPGL